MLSLAARAAVLGAVTLVYVAAGKAGLALAVVHPSATAVWPPAGIALAAVLLLGVRAWPAVFIGAFVVNVLTAGSVATSLGIAAGNTLEALAGAALVRRFPGRPLERASGVLAFALAVAIAGALAATVGVTSLVLGGAAPWAGYGSIWLTWWLGDVTGALVVAPTLVLWAREHDLGPLVGRAPEALALLATVVAVGLMVFGGVLPDDLDHLPLSFLALPPLVWSAFRFGPRETAAFVAVLAGIALVGTERGRGPFGVATPDVALLLLQAFMATAAVAALVIAVLVRQARQADAEVRATAEQVRLALEAGGMGTWEWDIAGGAVRWSERLEALHGLAAGTFAGTFEAFQADVHPDDRSKLQAAIAGALETGEHRIEYRIVRPDGAVRWVEGRGELARDAAGRPLRMIGVCTDITDRRRATDRLAFLGEIARSITSSLDLDVVLRRIAEGAQALCGADTAAIFLADSASGTMVPRSRVGPPLDAYRGLGIRPGEGIGGEAMATRRPVRVARYADDPRVPPAFLAIARETGTIALMVVPILVGEDVAGLLYISNRTPTSFTDEDETICVRLAEQAAVAIQNARWAGQQQAARAAAEAANRAKDEFLAMLGHELRNPLGALSSATRVLTIADPHGDEAAAAREVMGRQLRHLTRLVDDLLDVSRVMTRKIALRRERVDLGAVVRRTVDGLVGGDRPARHRVTVDAAPVWVDADPTRLEQIVSNLVENAAKYTPDGGTIVVRTARDGEQALLTVADSGIGIAADLLPQVFELFVQGDRSLDRRGGGLGIGLTLVRRLAELHDGAVTASSDGPDRGSTFTVHLPAAAAPAAAVDVAEPVSTPSPRARVLVVEDNDDAREMLCHLLRLAGHEVHEAVDGPTAVRLALSLKPDLVLVDVGLPGMDGYEVARHLRRDANGGAPLRLVALTGYGQPEDRARALAAGFDRHFVKPVDPAAIEGLL
jgi:PAS domain S-box-containing protein